MNHQLLSANEQYEVETFEQFQQRYNGFAKDLYAVLREVLPDIFAHLTFYKATRFQTTDSYAIYETKSNSFGIQLDPDIGVIVLFSEQLHTEIGFWSSDACKEAIEVIRNQLLSVN